MHFFTAPWICNTLHAQLQLQSEARRIIPEVIERNLKPALQTPQLHLIHDPTASIMKNRTRERMIPIYNQFFIHKGRSTFSERFASAASLA